MPTPAIELTPEPPGESFVCTRCGQGRIHEPRCAICESCVTCCACVYCEVCNRTVVYDASHPECGSCQRCCRCRVCQACEGRYPPTAFTCQNCSSCASCCRCITCVGCRIVRDSGTPIHRDCNRCLICCPCEGVVRPWRLNPGRPKFWPVKSVAERMKHGSRRFVSTEIEVSHNPNGNHRTAKAVAKWGGAIVSDGSVPGGFEINTAPAAGDHFLRQIDDICQGLQADGAVAGEGAGAHVHIDARDFTFSDMQRLVTLYSRIEDVLFALCSPSRASNSYCQPCGDKYIKHIMQGRMPPKKLKSQILTNLYGSDPGRGIAQIKSSKWSPVRYSALNLHSWIYRGTVECRMMQGSTNPENLSMWGAMWAHLLDAALSHKLEDLKAIPKNELGSLIGLMPKDSVRAWIANRWSQLHRTGR